VNLRRLFALSAIALGVFAALSFAGVFRTSTKTATNAVPGGSELRLIAPAQESGPSEAKQGATAPDFEAPTLSGERVRLSGYRGRAVVLNFWGTNCGACLAEIPALERVSQELSPQGLVVLGVNVGDNASRARSFFSDLGATYTSVLDPHEALARAYRAPGLPVTVFINADGRIDKLITGQLNYAVFDRFARVALGDKNVAGVDDPLPIRFIAPLPGQ
jgi:peroxiredoxin